MPFEKRQTLSRPPVGTTWGAGLGDDKKFTVDRFKRSKLHLKTELEDP